MREQDAETEAGVAFSQEQSPVWREGEARREEQLSLGENL